MLQNMASLMIVIDDTSKAGAKATSKTKHFYSTGVKYDCHLRSSKYFIVQATTWCVFEKLSSICSSKSSENNVMQNVY
jgi:hypothetical protein